VPSPIVMVRPLVTGNDDVAVNPPTVPIIFTATEVGAVLVPAIRPKRASSTALAVPATTIALPLVALNSILPSPVRAALTLRPEALLTASMIVWTVTTPDEVTTAAVLPSLTVMVLPAVTENADVA